MRIIVLALSATLMGAEENCQHFGRLSCGPSSSLYTDPSTLLTLDRPSVTDALSALASPALKLHPMRYKIALTANVALSTWLSGTMVSDWTNAELEELALKWTQSGDVLPAWALRSAINRSARRWADHVTGLGPYGSPTPGRQSSATSVFALRFLASQIAYLVGVGNLPRAPFLEHSAGLEKTAGLLLQYEASRNPSVYQCFDVTDLHSHFPVPPSFGRAVFERAPPDSWFSFDGPHPRLLSPAFDWSKVGPQYATESHVVIDNALRPEVADELFRWLSESTHWFDARWGYVGTYLDWWGHPAVILLADELAAAMPDVIGRHRLTQAWAYAYDNENGQEGGAQGIPEHADVAAINVNIWLTPDEHNGDPTGGGMCVFKRRPPAHWTPHEMNQRPELVRDFLRGDCKNITTAYKKNRIIIFDSKVRRAALLIL